MKLLYTGIREQLTQHLTDVAQEAAKNGKRVFYIAPNSLSFEKERLVLSQLEGQASFDIMVTRFAQLARYFTLKTPVEGQAIDDIGLSMLFFRVLSQLEDQELRVYGKLKKDLAFIEQLIDLYKELQTAQLTVLDLETIDSEDKRADLQTIFLAFEKALQEGNYQLQTKVGQFTQQVASGALDDELARVVLVIDGFTRFSAEEEALLMVLHGRVAEIVVGTYASSKALQATYLEGNLYQSSVEFLRHLEQLFGTTAVFVGKNLPLDGLGKMSQQLESHYDFSLAEQELKPEDMAGIRIWDVTSQKAEVEEVARAIRHDLQSGYRYKDILVLLGDVAAYQLQIGKIFDKYEIPYYFGKAEAMSHHPLVHFVESLERLKRYHFRSEDLLNLLKSGLYGQYTDLAVDQFEQYILFADVKGLSQFSKDFVVNVGKKYDLPTLNAMRQTIMVPLQTFFKAQPQSATSLLEKLMDLLRAVHLPENMEKLATGLGHMELEKEEQVWKSFVHILELTQTIFGKDKLRVDDFLALLRAGMLANHYRVVPATVDVVNVKSYDLIEPHSAKLVYAIGLTQSNFPKVAKNNSLLTDEERGLLNHELEGRARLEVATKDSGKKNHFAMLSLLNAAEEKLVLSAPQLFQETADHLSPYLKLLVELGVSVEEKGRSHRMQASDIGHYKSLLSRVIEVNRLDFDTNWSKEEETFWSVAVRYLRKKLTAEGIEIPTITGEIDVTPLAQETLDVLYPTDQPLQLSASSVTDFYRNEYLYFLRHVLRLDEQDSIRPDARSHGNFLHRIFERLMTDTDVDFDRKLTRAIAETRQESAFAHLYQQDAESQFSETVLLDIARATSLVLRDDSIIRVVADEAVFGEQNSNLLTLENGRAVNIRGKIDRLDALQTEDAIGIVDYKSSDNSFKLDRFYNGLSPQLLTYIAAVRNHPTFSQTEKVFGAMYLHMLDPIVDLKSSKGADQVLAEAYKSLVYKGLFLEEDSNRLNQFYYKTKNSLFTQSELETLLAHNEQLYKQAAERILSGHFAVNPYTEDGRSVAGEQLKAITGFEANRHFAQARPLVKGGKREDWLERMQKGGTNDL